MLEARNTGMEARNGEEDSRDAGRQIHHSRAVGSASRAEVRCVTGRSFRIRRLISSPRCRDVDSESSDRASELAADAFVVPDLYRGDDEGREVGDILIDDLLFSYWVDHPVKMLMIVEVEDVS